MQENVTESSIRSMKAWSAAVYFPFDCFIAELRRINKKKKVIRGKPR